VNVTEDRLVTHAVAGGMTWDVFDDERAFLLDRLVPVLDGPADGVARCVIKQSRVRTVTRIEMPEGRVVFVKHYKTVRPLDRLLFSLLPHRTRSRREWKVIRALQRKAPEVLVPRPIAVGTRRVSGLIRDGRLVLAEIPESTPIGREFEHGDLDPGERKRIIEMLGELTRLVVAAGLYHRDFHVGNVLVSRRGQESRLALIDLHAARVGQTCGKRQCDRMLARMWRSLDVCGVSEDECEKFVEIVVGRDELAERLPTVRELERRFKVRQWKSRSKRCMKNSTKFEQGKTVTGRYSVLREFGLETLRSTVDLHSRDDAGVVTTLKKDGPGWVTAVAIDGDRVVCIKEVRATGFRKWLKTALRRGRGRRAWIAANGLLARGFAAPRQFGYLSERLGFMDMVEYVVMEYLTDCPSMADYVETPAYTCASPSTRRGFFAAFARYLATLHERGVHQHDFKAANVLVHETEDGGWTFYLVDLDSVKFRESVSERRRIKNLGQLSSALPENVSTSHRLRFVRAYTKAADLTWDERAVVRRVISIAARRGGPWYGPPTNVVNDD
jgi:tRNA A-37 threonylcarbamoyl transferase component Bud32